MAASPRSFFDYAQAFPHTAAVVEDDGTVTTYARLRERADRGSHALRGLGVGPGDRVAVVAPNSADFLAVALACAQIGVHLVTVNWHFTADEVAYLLADSGALAVLVAAGSEAVVRDAMAHNDDLRTCAVLGLAGSSGLSSWEHLLAAAPTTPPADRVYAGVMLYTSGTTGRPKGVVWPRSQATPEDAVELAVPLMARRGLRHGAGTPTLVVGPLYHGAPFGWAFYALNFGHTVYLFGAWDGVRLVESIERHEIETVQLAPIHLQRLLALPAEVRARHSCRSLRTVSHAGAPTPVSAKRAMIDWWGPVLVEYYAASEGFGTSITSEEWLEHPGSVGRADGDGATMQVRDEDGKVLPPGSEGTLWIRNPGGVLSRYHNGGNAAPESADGFYTVGDMATIDEDGWLYILDRRVDMILSGGVNVYPAEVEQALERHPAVAAACVVGVPDPEWGQRPVAVLVPAAGVTPDAALTTDVLAATGRHVARFKLPRETLWREELPYSDTGKLLRRIVRQQLA